MPRLTSRDLVTIAVFVGLVAVVAVLTLLGNMAWALIVLAGLAALIGVTARLEFAARRQDLRLQRRDVHHTRRVVEQMERTKPDRVDRVVPPSIPDLVALRAEIRGMRVAQQLISQTITATKGDVQESEASIAELQRRIIAIDDGIRATHADLAERVVLRVSGLDLVREKFQQLQGELVDDVQGIYQLFGRFAPVAPLPSLAGSSLGAVGTFFLADAIEQRQADCILHRGNRVTGLWMAYALRRRGRGSLIVLEGNNDDAQRTRALLAEHDLEGWAEVRVDNLSSAVAVGESGELDRGLTQRVDLLVLDEDTSDVSRVFRYPTPTVLARILAPDALVVVADAVRGDVREVIRTWEEAEPGLTRVASPRHDVAVFAPGPATSLS